MTTISKDWTWFYVSSKEAKWWCENKNENSSFWTCSKEQRAKKTTPCFDWPWEYEMKGIEIKWVEINDKGIVSFSCLIERNQIMHIPENVWDIREDFLDKIDDIDTLLISIWADSNLDDLKKLIDKIEARIIVFWWENPGALKDKFANCEELEELKITSLPVDQNLYYILN